MAETGAHGDYSNAMADQPPSGSQLEPPEDQTTEPELLVLDPNHNLEIIIVTTEIKVVKRVQLLREPLCVASPVWRAMLTPGGPFVESTSSAIRFEEEYPDEFALLLSLTHPQCATTPTSLSFDELFGLAVTCDKYDVGSVVRPFYRGWVEQLQPLHDGDTDVEWCFISRVFLDYRVFSVAVERLVLTASFDRRSGQCLTSGGAPIRDLTPMSTEWVDEWRTHILGLILRVCNRFLEKLAATADKAPSVCQNGGDRRSPFRSFDTCHRCRLPVKNVCRFEFEEDVEGSESCIAVQLWHFVQSMRSLNVPLQLQRVPETCSGQPFPADSIDHSVADFVGCFDAIVFQTWPGHEICSIQTDFSLAIYRAIRRTTSRLAWKFVSSFPVTDMESSLFEGRGNLETRLIHRYEFEPEDFDNIDTSPEYVDACLIGMQQQSQEDGSEGDSESESQDSDLNFDENLDPMDFEDEMQEAPSFGVAEMLGVISHQPEAMD